MAKVAVYPGSFDPMTLGHLDILTRASKLFDRVIMAVAQQSSGKRPLFTIEERLRLIRDNVTHLPNVSVEAFSGLTVAFAQSHQASVIIRGLRAVSDFEYEFKMYQMNMHLNPEIETVFMMAGPEYHFLSSSMVKEVALLGGDVTGLVPPSIGESLAKTSSQMLSTPQKDT